MKKSYLSLIVLAAILPAFAASCSLEPEVSVLPSDTASATIETLTRTQLSQDGDFYKVLWNKGDRIAVSDLNSTAYYTADSGGSVNSTFTLAEGSVPAGDSFTAWYPSSIAGGFLPQVQKYSADGVVESPMSADSGTLDFSFRNLCGIIRLDVTTAQEGISIDRIVLSADQGLSGAFYRNGDEAVVTDSDGVRLDCGGVSLGSKPVSFYISVPANNYTGLAIMLYTADGRCQRVALKEGTSYRVKRSQVCEIALEANDFTVNHYNAAVLRHGNDFNYTLKILSGTKRGVAEADSVIRRIVFETGSKVSDGLRADAYDSPWPIYMNWDKASGTITVSTPADSYRSSALLSHMFAYLYALEEIVNLQLLDTSPAEDMGSMFKYAGSRAESSHFDVSKFKTSNVRVFYQMFQHCESVDELDLSGFDTSSAVNMDNMFAHCYKLRSLDLSSFNTAGVQTFRSMFNRCESIEELNLDNFDTSSGQLMTYMFYKMVSVKKISIRGFEINHTGANVGYMFQYCPNLAELNVGEGFVGMSLPTNFFTNSSDADGSRTSSLSKKLTIRCTENSADWLAKTTLRWVHNGYKNKKPVEVSFIDDKTGAALNPTWPN